MCWVFNIHGLFTPRRWHLVVELDIGVGIFIASDLHVDMAWRSRVFDRICVWDCIQGTGS